MGYRSDAVIGIRKEVLVRHLIRPEIPECLKHVESWENNGRHYYKIDSWKWYSSYSDIQEIEKWFASMDDEDFGAMRIGEDDKDIETWGDPYEFEIHLNRYIDCPN